MKFRDMDRTQYHRSSHRRQSVSAIRSSSTPVWNSGLSSLHWLFILPAELWKVCKVNYRISSFFHFSLDLSFWQMYVVSNWLLTAALVSLPYSDYLLTQWYAYVLRRAIALLTNLSRSYILWWNNTIAAS